MEDFTVLKAAIAAVETVDPAPIVPVADDVPVDVPNS